MDLLLANFFFFVLFAILTGFAIYEKPGEDLKIMWYMVLAVHLVFAGVLVWNMWPSLSGEARLFGKCVGAVLVLLYLYHWRRYILGIKPKPGRKKPAAARRDRRQRGEDSFAGQFGHSDGPIWHQR